MARIDNLTNFVNDIATSIKLKKGYPSTQKILARNFDTEITNIPSTGEPDTETYMRIIDLACFSPRRYSEKDYTAEEVSKVEELLNKGVSV